MVFVTYANAENNDKKKYTLLRDSALYSLSKFTRKLIGQIHSLMSRKITTRLFNSQNIFA